MVEISVKFFTFPYSYSHLIPNWNAQIPPILSIEIQFYMDEYLTDEIDIYTAVQQQ